MHELDKYSTLQSGQILSVSLKDRVLGIGLNWKLLVCAIKRYLGLKYYATLKRLEPSQMTHLNRLALSRILLELVSDQDKVVTPIILMKANNCELNYEQVKNLEDYERPAVWLACIIYKEGRTESYKALHERRDSFVREIDQTQILAEHL